MNICTYCKKECSLSIVSEEDDNVMFGYHLDFHEKWTDCKSCNASYFLKGNTVEITRLYLELRDNLYCVDFFHNPPKTEIIVLPSVANTFTLLIDYPYIMKNINPTNIKEKLSLLLIYI